MTLTRRIHALEGRVPRRRKGRPVPDDPVAFARGLLAGLFGPADLDPRHPDHTGWLTRVYAFLTTLLPDHQEGLRGTGIGPASANVDKLAALDAVMRRG